jgi:hypothetical protein
MFSVSNVETSSSKGHHQLPHFQPNSVKHNNKDQNRNDDFLREGKLFIKNLVLNNKLSTSFPLWEVQDHFLIDLFGTDHL